ncbi:MAG: hypothetical protein IJZ26_00455 [Clostridia bacterium]|nr:hypothetical protein [Clostridia bacterium]
MENNSISKNESKDMNSPVKIAKNNEKTSKNDVFLQILQENQDVLFRLKDR